MRPVRALLYGTVAVAVLEAVETSAFWWLYRRVTPWQIFRYISSGLHGASALEGGSSSTWLGVAIHFFNAFVIVGVYFLASRRFPTLIRHPVTWGLAYGAGVHLVMAYVVVPLSAAESGGSFSLFRLVHSLVSQAVTVGLPAALFARASSPADRAPAAVRRESLPA